MSDLVEQDLRDRAKFMREAGHDDDADLDIRAADRIEALERERDEARGIIMAREALHAANLGVDFDRISVLTARDMARQALDAKAALAASQVEVIRLKEALRADGRITDARLSYLIGLWVTDHPDVEGSEYSGTYPQDIYLLLLAERSRRARSVLEEQKP